MRHRRSPHDSSETSETFRQGAGLLLRREVTEAEGRLRLEASLAKNGWVLDGGFLPGGFSHGFFRQGFS